MKDEVVEKLNPATAAGILVVIVFSAMLFSESEKQVPATGTSDSVILTAAHTNTTANVRECASVSTCKSVGTYPPNTTIDISTYRVTDVSQLPEWVSFSYANSDGSTATGYISKITLSNGVSTNTSAASSPNEAQTGANTAQETSPLHASDLPSIIKEWRKRAAYVTCQWFYSNDTTGQPYYSDSASGMLIDYSNVGIRVITNAHVVKYGAYFPTKCFAKFPGDNGYYGPITTSDIYINSDGTDGASLGGLIQNQYFNIYSLSLQQRTASAVNLCQSPEIGDKVLILGYPSYGSSINPVGSIEITATEGIISGMDGYYYTTSAKIEHGNSGGIAIDEDKDCYLGVPSAATVGSIESLGRILPASFVIQ